MTLGLRPEKNIPSGISARKHLVIWEWITGKMMVDAEVAALR